MFLVIISFPPIKAGKDAQFREWLTSTNPLFSSAPGFIGRKLLKPMQGGNYTAIVEFESQETFKTMQGSAAHDQAAKQVIPLFDGHPTPQFFEVIGKI